MLAWSKFTNIGDEMKYKMYLHGDESTVFNENDMPAG